MNDKQPSLKSEVIYEGSLIGVLWRLLLGIAVNHLGGLVVFIVFLLLTEQPWTLGLMAFLFFVVFVWITELVFHTRGD